MGILSGQSDFFGLDIGTSALRAVELRGHGTAKSLAHYGYIQIVGTAALSDAEIDRQKVSQAIKEMVRQSGIETKNVAVNLPSQKVFTTIIDMDKAIEADLDKTIRYQADSIIPTPIAQSKIDWVVTGPSPTDAQKIEVLLSSVPNVFIENRLEMLEAAGLNVVAMEPDSMALARALTSPEINLPQMILDIGNTNTDLVIVVSGIPRLARSIPIGMQAFIRAAVSSPGIDDAQAAQYVMKFGLGRDKLEGRIYQAILPTVDALISEVDKSIQFFQGRYQTAKIDRIIVTGGAAILPELPLYIANKFSLNVEIGNSWRNVSAPVDKQNELLSLSNHFAVAVGMAERD